jgi:hypothetical protein
MIADQSNMLVVRRARTGRQIASFYEDRIEEVLMGSWEFSLQNDYVLPLC